MLEGSQSSTFVLFRNFKIKFRSFVLFCHPQGGFLVDKNFKYANM
jgi:hypothetical protein